MGISHSARRAPVTFPPSAAEIGPARAHAELMLDDWHDGEPFGQPVPESRDNPDMSGDDIDGADEDVDNDEDDEDGDEDRNDDENEDNEVNEDDEDDEDYEGMWDACAICCEVFLNIARIGSEDPMDTSEPGIVLLCQQCGMKVCGACMAEMFRGATNDPTRMPPKCCKNLGIHLARPYLTDAQASAYRDKFDEWVSCKKVYCPVATCSAFIADRLRPTDPLAQPNYACPRNESHLLCSKCHSLDHSGFSCATATASSASMGEMLNLIGSWGYKQCPRCGTAVKRMYGCAHMQCLCGAHFCWACLKPIGQCEQSEMCKFSEDHDETDENDSWPNENLDSRLAQDWTLGFDFGQDPGLIRGSAAQAWCCGHHLIKLPWSETELDGRNCRGAHLLECSRCWTSLHPPTFFADQEQQLTCPLSYSVLPKPVLNQRPCSVILRNKSKNCETAETVTGHPSPTAEQDSHALQDAWICVDCGLFFCWGCVLGTKALKSNMCLNYNSDGEEKVDGEKGITSGTRKRPRADTDPPAPASKKQH